MNIPAEHKAKLESATTAQVEKIRDHNSRRARQDWAAGHQTEARRWYAYVDTCQAILDARNAEQLAEITGHQQPTPRLATARQVETIARKLKRVWSWGLEPRLERLITDETIDRGRIASLTRGEASEIITILTEQY